MSALTQLKLRGPVHTLRTEFAEWDIGQEEWQAPRHSSIVQFRPDGEVIEREDQNPNGSVSRSRFFYDDAGRLLETEFRLDEGPISKMVHRYDESGRLMRKITVDGNGAESYSATYSYDDSGRKRKRESVPKPPDAASCGVTYGVEGARLAYGAEGVATITTLYDDREQPCEALFHNEDQEIVLRVILTRDSAGRLIKEESRCGDQPPFPVAQALENSPVEERAAAAAAFAQLFSPEKMMWSTTYCYDDGGREIECATSMAGMSENRQTWEYDEHDNPIREIDETNSHDLQAAESGNLQSVNKKSFRREIRYQYKYDSHGNWTERVISVRYETNPDFQRSNIERREIAYYP